MGVLALTVNASTCPGLLNYDLPSSLLFNPKHSSTMSQTSLDFPSSSDFPSLMLSPQNLLDLSAFDQTLAIFHECYQ